MSKNKLNWNAIPLESAISCIPSNRQSEISSTSEHENIRCRTPLINVNKNAECEASSMGADDINYNEATLSTVYDTSCTLQTLSNSSYPALNSNFASSSITQSTDLTENHENDIEMLVSDKDVQFLLYDEMHNKTAKGCLKTINLSQKQLSQKNTKMYTIHRYYN